MVNGYKVRYEVFHVFSIFSAEEPIFKVAIPTGGPKVTSMIWSGLDDLLVTGHDNGDLVQWDVKTQKKLKLTSGLVLINN